MRHWMDSSMKAFAVLVSSRRATSRAARVTLCVVSLALVLAPSAGAATTAPPNDAQGAAQTIHALPATLDGTLVGATSEGPEPGSQCGSTAGSVWYSIRASSAQRVAADLSAAGALEATVDVYHVVRSQLNPIACDRTDAKGKAALSFKASQNGLYLIRVAALQNSQLASFSLTVFLPTPAVRPPGVSLPGGGVNGQVDPIQNVNAAYAVTLHAGVSYLLNLSHRGEACVNGQLFAPGTRSFEDGSPVLHVFCGGYRLFTPGPGQGGRYSFEVTPGSGRGVHRFRFQLARADSSETAPGLPLGNYAQGHGHLSGTGVHVLRLYRMTVTSHSNLTLKLKAPDSAGFNLQLRSFNGHVIECQCGDSGSQTLQRQVKPGRYYAVVSVHDASSGSFTLTRESRTITTTRLSFSTANAHPGQSVGVDVKVSPTASGRATVQIERFDPVFGWQFYRQSEAVVRGGSASVGFVAPSVGRWRVKASYAGSRTASPSAVGYSYLTVA
jgi:hypothetical protein